MNLDDRSIVYDRLQRDKPYAMEHMCYKDGQNLKLLYNQLGYYNKMNIHELKKISLRNNNYYKQRSLTRTSIRTNFKTVLQ